MENALSDDEVTLLQRVEANLQKLRNFTNRMLEAGDAEYSSEPLEKPPMSPELPTKPPTIRERSAPPSSPVYTQGIMRYTHSPSKRN